MVDCVLFRIKFCFSVPHVTSGSLCHLITPLLTGSPQLLRLVLCCKILATALIRDSTGPWLAAEKIEACGLVLKEPVVVTAYWHVRTLGA